MFRTTSKRLAGGSEVLGGGVAIVDGQALGCGVDLRYGDVARGGVGADHGGTKARHGFGQQAAAAADVEDAKAGERQGF